MGGLSLAVLRGRRTRFVLGATAIAAMFALAFAPWARAADPVLERTNDRLEEAAQLLDRLSAASQLAQATPLSNLAPAGALDLADVFDDAGAGVDSLRDKLAAVGAIDTEGQFENLLDGLDFTNADGIVLTVGGPNADDADDAAVDGEPDVVKNGSVVDVTLKVTVSKQVDVPLQFATSIVDLVAANGQGTFPVTFTLETTNLHFQYDDALNGTADHARAIRLLTTPDVPRLTFSAATAGGGASLGQLSTSLGFTAITVDGTLDFDFGAQLELLDPDASGGGTSDGKIDGVELSSTALEDLVSGGLTDNPATDAVHAVVTVASDLLDSPDDADTDPANDTDLTITYDDDSLIDAVAPSTTFNPTTPPIADFKNFSVQEALGSLLRLVSMLDSIQGTGKLDPALPFVSGKVNNVDPAAAAHGTFSDVLRIGMPLLEAITNADGVANDTNDLAEPSPDPANPNAIGAPKFTNAQDLLAKLAAALGLDSGDLGLTYDQANQRLAYTVNLSGSDQTSSLINFGNLDILSSVQVDTAGTIGLSASFDIPLTFALDLSPEPTEGVGAPIGSCTDGIDNNGVDGIDADDPACANAETLEGRVALQVGTTPGTPELTARAGVRATGVGASAKIGILEAGIADADLTIGSNDGEGGGGLASCQNGTDNDTDTLVDMADPDCQSALTFDFTDTADGWLTIRDLINSLGAGTPPAGVSFGTNLDAAIDSTVPVSASIGGTPLVGGDITAAATFDGPLSDVGALITALASGIDASDLHASDLFAFSPCDNATDDDGDGVANDGCTGGPPAEDEPETSSTALLVKVIAAVRTVADSFENLGIFPPGTLDTPIPLLGKSFNDLVSFVESFTQTADQTDNGAESAIGASACTGSVDDDFDGIVNDGCPAQGSFPESDCSDVDNADLGLTAAPNDDPGDDSAINDGCQPEKPSLQKLADALAGALERLLAGVPNSTANVTSTLAYDATTEDAVFTLDVDFDYTTGTELNLELPGLLGSLISLDAIANLNLAISADLTLGLGINVGTGTPFLLGNTALDLAANLSGTDLFFEVGIGAFKLQVGQVTATPEATDASDPKCTNNTDDDGDGFANDGCPIVPDPEAGADCGNKVDDDGDGAADDGCGDTDDPQVGDDPEAGADCAGDNNEVDNDEDGTADDGCPADPATTQGPNDGEADAGPDDPNCAITDTDSDDTDTAVNDGCPARADRARVFLGGGLNLDLGTDAPADDTVHYAFNALSFSGGFAGVPQAGCADLGDPDPHACAVLPLYFDADGPGGNPPAPVGPDTATGHHVEVVIDDLSNPTDIDVNYDTSELDSFIQSQLIDLLLLNSGLSDLLGVLRNLLESDLLSFALPLIGGQGASAADIVDSIEQKVKDAIATAMSGTNPLSGSVSAGQVETAVNNIKDAIANAFSGATGLTLPENEIQLFCSDDDDTPRRCDPGKAENDATNPALDEGDDPTDNCTTPGDEDGDGTANDGCGDPATEIKGHSALQVVDIRFLLTIEGDLSLFDQALDFDIGIPGLGLSGTLTPQGTVGWEIHFGFGVSKTDGFYFVTDFEEGGEAKPELAVDLEVRLSPEDTNQPPGKLFGTLGFLAVQAVDGDPAGECQATISPDPDNPDFDTACRRAGDTVDPRSLLAAHFKVDVGDPDDDGKLTFAELTSSPNFGDLIAFSFEAEADVNLHIETGFPGGAGLPKLVGDLHITWDWAIGDPDDTSDYSSNLDALEPGTGSTLNIYLDSVGLDVGTYINKFLKPIFSDIKRFTDPLKPILDTLSACIPVLSDLAGSCISLLTLAETLNPGGYVPDFVFDVIKILNFVTAISNLSSVPGNIVIPIGDGTFNLAGDRLREGTLDPTQARDAYGPGELAELDDDDLLAGLNSQPFVQNAGSADLSADGLSDVGVSFPFLQEPAKLLGLLFGQDVDLIVWEDELSISFSYSQKFGPIWAVPPVFLEIGGSASATARFGIGYSTKGLRNAIFNDGGPAALLQGIFLVDRHPLNGGPDSNELELTGELFANAQVSVLIFSAGAQGSVFLTIGIDLNDPNSDGRVEYDEMADIIRTTGSVLCIFNLNGQFGIRISVFAEVDLFFWSHRWEKTLAEIILYEFKITCDPLPDPILAEVVGTTLHLNIGTRRANRGVPSIGQDVTAENFTVTQEANGSMTVAALGVTQNYIGAGNVPITHVVGDASDPPATPADQLEDRIALVDGKADGGGKVSFTATSNLAGGDGNDQLLGGIGANTLNGGGGNDNLSSRDLNSQASGASDTMTGGPGNDVMESGKGDDHLFGEAGDDRLSAGSGADEIVGGVDHDNIDGGRSVPAVGSNPASPDGGDSIWGDNKNDNDDAAGVGNDTIDSGDGNDTVHAGGGTDRVDGGTGTDTITAGGGGTACVNGDIDDVLIGGQAADSISAGGGDDIVIGGNVLSGVDDVGDTSLDGGADCDLIFGDNAVQGEGGPRDVTPIDPSIGGGDTITGGSGADVIHGQKGADNVHAGDGDDLVIGDEAGNPPGGDDILFGESGEDTMFGGPGDDDLIGGADGASDGDHLFGDADQDFLLGDDGTVNRTGARDSHDPTFTGGGTLGDDLHGGADRDHLYGQGGADEVYGDGADDDAYGDSDDPAFDTSDGIDLVHGNLGADYLFGGNGADDMYGDSQNDRMVGGYPSADGNDDGTKADGFGDHMFGGTGNDTMAGDDATITTGGAVTLLAEATQGQDDLMFGESGDDAMYGENGNDDIYGSSGIDHAEGGDDDDDIFGEDGDDDLIGGTTEPSDAAAALGDNGGQPDGSDNITGGPGHDALLGDNGQVIRPGGFRPDGAPNRDIALWDLDSSDLGLSGEENLQGNAGNDDMYGGAEHDIVHGADGDDYGEGNNGADELFGEAGQDDLIGGTSGEVDEDGNDAVGGNHPDQVDIINGGDGVGGVVGNDHDVECGDNCSIRRFAPASGSGWQADDLDTTRGIVDVIRRQVQLYDIGEVGSPAPAGTSGGETMFGEDGYDIMYGQGGDDTLNGGPVDDYLEGNEGHDTAYGHGGQDDIVGGTGRTVSDDPSTATNGRLDTDDDLFGGDGAGGVLTDDFDVLMGDNATVLRGAPFPTPDPGSAWQFNTFNASIKRALFLYDVGLTGAPVPADTNGPDEMFGEENDDVMYGQGDGDNMVGADGDDYMEGNEGGDTILGQNDNDDMIGGTGRINTDPPLGVDGRLDSAEFMQGGDGFDVMAGDNAIIRRVLSPSGAWLQNTFNDGVQHERIQLLDLASVSNPGVPSDVSGGDTMEGNEDDDVMYGQGNAGAVDTGNPDVMNGNDGDDYMEGNFGGDVMEGNANQDDMIGGTGRVNQDPPEGTNGRFDGDDLMHGDSAAAGEGGDGGDDYDVMTGDNSVIDRPLTPLPEGDWKLNTFNDGIERSVTMLDLELASQPAVDGRVHGNDTMFGNGDDDIMRGQGGDDTMHGNDGDDDMQGNHAVDHMYGEAHQDDMIGGSTVAGRRDAGDFMFGGADHDVMLGDNGTLVRPLTPLPAGDWQTQTYGHVVDSPDPDDEFHDQVVAGSFTRVVRTVGMVDTDVALIGPLSGSDLVNGNSGDDELFGQFDDTDTTGIADDANVPVLCDGVTPPTVDDPDVPGVDASPVPIEGDLLCGEDGEDAIVGDQGTIVDVAETGAAATTLAHNGAPFIKEPVRPAGQLTRQVTLTQIPDGGDDVAIGGLDHDSIHTGSGNDLANGGDYINPQGDIAWDILFLGDDIDAGWGGPGHDHIWGGYEADFLDVVPRRDAQFPPSGDPLAWFLFAADDPDTVGDPTTPFGEGFDGYQGTDIIYGGWAQDALQANEGGNGPVPGDRLLDWAGAYNSYYVCPPTFGEHISTRQESPSLIAFLIDLAGHDGATTVATGDRTNSSGFNELAMVYKKDIKFNTNPAHPDTPGHFTCE